MKIISGLSNPILASKIARSLNIELLSSKISQYQDGELKIYIEGKIDQDIIIVQSTNTPVNDRLMELLLLVDTAKRAGAKNIIAIIPYFGYSRQDRCTYKNGPISASLVIKIIEAAGITDIIVCDLHSTQLEGVFNIPITNLSTESIFTQNYKNKQDAIIISPDIGGIVRARNYSDLLGLDLAIINKSRDTSNNCMMSEVIGNVSNKHCIIVDDIVDSADTLCLATDLLVSKGAKSVEAVITHGVLSGDAINKIEKSPVNKIYITDSIYHNNLPRKFNVISISDLICSTLNISGG